MKARLIITSLVLLTALSGQAIFLKSAMTQKNTEKRESEGSVLQDALPALRDPKIVIRKEARLLELYDGSKLIRSYPIALGFAPAGDKEREGDGKTPEGEFFIFTKNRQSRFHLSLGVSYPSIDDAKRGYAEGIIRKADHDAIISAIGKKKMPPQNTALGGEIYIHGGGATRDWTLGCPAMNNPDIEEIYNAVPVGTPVTIRP